ncbi:MAG: cupin domain-containing protein [Gammaproteobacteria bacterium]|nr:cupin domain-containing protein [Gammaproteobacteria bacterium]MCY4358759.1 cupin domain-containing protein [Gammaproteobacteria bacterium]
MSARKAWVSSHTLHRHGLLVALCLVSSFVLAQEVAYQPVTREELRVSQQAGPLEWKVLVDAVNLGGTETRIAELTFNTSYVGEPHTHDAIEIFYVLSGRFGHNVNGVPAVLEAGEIGICRPGDTIIHSVEGDEPAVVLTIWLPGGAFAPLHVP